MPISKNFIIQEFVPQSVYEKWGEKSIWFVQPRIILLAQFLREKFGRPVTINDWHNGGSYQERGYRLPDSPTGGYQSQHKFGNAIDFNIYDLTPDEIRHEILANQSVFMSNGLTTLEDAAYAPTWVHGDCRNTRMDEILIVKP